MRIAIRVDASLEIGSGHVMRCLTLAETLRDNGAEVMFICRPHVGNLNALIEARGFELAQLAAPNASELILERPLYSDWLGAQQLQDAVETAQAISHRTGHVDWIIVDHYAIANQWETAMRESATQVMVIDDLADRQHDCDLLLDQNLVADHNERYHSFVPTNCKTLLGPRFALLQSDYASLHADSVVREGDIKRVLIYFGAVDLQNLSEKAVRAFSNSMLSDIHLDVVSAASNPNLSALRALCAARGKAELHIDLPSLAPILHKADLAVGASGATSWERICLGLPALVVTLSENQLPLAQELHRRGAIVLLGHATAVTEKEFARALVGQRNRGKPSLGLQDVFAQIDGEGAKRVSSALQDIARKNPNLRLRLATPIDEKLLLDWANEPDIRSRSLTTQSIKPEQHQIWFSRRINSSNCTILIAENVMEAPLGYVRFEKDGTDWQISYAIDQAHRGRGLGRPMLEAGIDFLRRQNHAVCLKALVHYDNFASRRIFKQLNFDAGPEANDIITYTKSYETL